MNTKFILHGGSADRKSNDNKKFFRAIINSVDSNVVKILCIYFARPEQRWEESFSEDTLAFLSVKEDKKIDLKMAKLETEELIKDIKNADVIFISGGMKGCLKEKLLEVVDFREIIEGKVVVGISAGTNILCKYYYSNVTKKIREGIDILSVKIFCHYEESMLDELRKLEEYNEDLPAYNVPEEKFIILEF